MTACHTWLSREYLIGYAAKHRPVWLTPTVARLDDGRLWPIPDPCACPAEDCPPHDTTPATNLQEAA